MISLPYYDEIKKRMDDIVNFENKKIEQGAKEVARVIENKGIIYIFGCGHSHIIAEECFYRAGGLANVSAIFDEDLMLHNGAAKSSGMERMEELAPLILDRYEIKDSDLLIIVSSSGINGVPVESALYGKRNNIKTIGISSGEYKNEKSRHSSGKLLYESVDIFIDNHVIKGDAAVPMGETNMGPLSTILSTFVIQNILLCGTEIAIKNGAKPDIYKSGNVKDGSLYNKKLIDKYRSRIKHL